MSDDTERNDDAKRGYEVGYRKPPKHTQFKPGKSGNPRGRPKGTKNLATDLREELGETVLVREGDRAKRISKQRALVKSLMTRTLKGDARAATLLTSMMLRLLDTGEDAPVEEAPLLDDELDVLNAFAERARRGASPQPEVTNAPSPHEEEEE